MKVTQQYMVFYANRWQLMNECENNIYFITANGAFNQRDMYFEIITPDQAKQLIDKTNKQ